MIGILHHPKVPTAEPLASQIEAWLTERGYTTWKSPIQNELDDQVQNSKLLIALGGDGSILHTARLGAAHGTEIFSVNLGRLGFLSEASPEDWQARLTAVLAGQYRVEKRLMLHAHVERDGAQLGNLTALNEVVVSRGRQARVLHFKLYVDGDLVTSIVADGIITATATGSTAYALAAGGPILPPELLNFVIVPVAPHLSLDRPIVLHEEATVTIHVEFDHEASITADGSDSIDLVNGDTVVITRAPHQSLFARVDDPSYFFRRLLARGVALRRN